MEIITKGIICHHFWRVMLYLTLARFHINIIPNRWYKDSILIKLDTNLKNSPILNAIKPSDTSPIQITFTLHSLYQLQGSSINNEVNQKISQSNNFSAGFSV